MRLRRQRRNRRLRAWSIGRPAPAASRSHSARRRSARRGDASRGAGRAPPPYQGCSTRWKNQTLASAAISASHELLAVPHGRPDRVAERDRGQEHEARSRPGRRARAAAARGSRRGPRAAARRSASGDRLPPCTTNESRSAVSASCTTPPIQALKSSGGSSSAPGSRSGYWTACWKSTSVGAAAMPARNCSRSRAGRPTGGSGARRRGARTRRPCRSLSAACGPSSSSERRYSTTKSRARSRQPSPNASAEPEAGGGHGDDAERHDELRREAELLEREQGGEAREDHGDDLALRSRAARIPAVSRKRRVTPPSSMATRAPTANSTADVTIRGSDVAAGGAPTEAARLKPSVSSASSAATADHEPVEPPRRRPPPARGRAAARSPIRPADAFVEAQRAQQEPRTSRRDERRHAPSPRASRRRRSASAERPALGPAAQLAEAGRGGRDHGSDSEGRSASAWDHLRGCVRDHPGGRPGPVAGGSPRRLLGRGSEVQADDGVEHVEHPVEDVPAQHGLAQRAPCARGAPPAGSESAAWYASARPSRS